MKPPTLYATAHVDALATIQWDEESFTVSCKIDYLTQPDSVEPGIGLSESIEQHLNIHPPVYVITGGMLSLFLDAEKRLERLDFYTNPAGWANCSFPFVDASTETLRIEASFDKNGQGESIREPDVFYEPVRGTLYLVWDDVSAWSAIAPSLALGIATDKSLGQIRLDGLFVRRSEQERIGPWT